MVIGLMAMAIGSAIGTFGKRVMSWTQRMTACLMILNSRPVRGAEHDGATRPIQSSSRRSFWVEQDNQWGLLADDFDDKNADMGAVQWDALMAQVDDQQDDCLTGLLEPRRW